MVAGDDQAAALITMCDQLEQHTRFHVVTFDIAALQYITRGADMHARGLSSPASEAGSFTPLAMMDGGNTRYNSGSHVDSKDYRLAMGTRYQATDNVSAGLLAEYERSNFSTYTHSDTNHSTERAPWPFISLKSSS